MFCKKFCNKITIKAGISRSVPEVIIFLYPIIGAKGKSGRTLYNQDHYGNNLKSVVFIPDRVRTNIIKKILLEKKWSQRKLARLSGIPIATLNDIINHKKLITTNEAEKIANAFGFSDKESLYKITGG
jgi:DNA-binding Xre family transcriptional regulator